MKRPIKVYLSAHSEDLASASRVTGLMLGELGCEVVADYTPVEKSKQCRTNRRRSLQRCNVFLQLVGRDAGPILAPEHQHDSLCSVAVWEAGEASALQKPVVRMLLADDFPFDESERREDSEEVSRFQTMHRHRLMSHQRSVLPVEDYEDLVQRLGRMWGGTFARQHKLPDLGLGSDSVDEICARVRERLFEKGPPAPHSEGTPPESAGKLAPAVHGDVAPPSSEAPVLPLKQASIAASSAPITQIVARPVGTIFPRGQVRGDVTSSQKQHEGTIGENTAASAHAVDEMPLGLPENTEQCSPDDSPWQATATSQLAESKLATEDSSSLLLPPSADTDVSSKLPPAAQNPIVQATSPGFLMTCPLSDCPPAGSPDKGRKATLANENNANEALHDEVETSQAAPSTSQSLPIATLRNPPVRVPIIGLSAPAMVIAASRHALFLSLLEPSGAAPKQTTRAENSPGEEPPLRPARGPESVLQSPMKLEFSRPMLHAPSPLAGSAPQQWRAPFRRRLPSTNERSASSCGKTPSVCMTVPDSQSTPAASVVGTLKFPGDTPGNSLSGEAKVSGVTNLPVGRHRSLYTKQIRMTFAVVGGMLLWALGLLLHAGWKYFANTRPASASKTEVTTSSVQRSSMISQSSDEPSGEMAASSQTPSVSSSISGQKSTGAGKTHSLNVSTPGSASAKVTEDLASPTLTLEEEQDVLECHLEAAIVRMRQNSELKEYSQAQETLLRDILPKFQELAPKVVTRESRRSPRALAISRHLASIHLLCNHPQAAQNALLDMREYLSETRTSSDAEVRLADYLVELTDGYISSSLQGSATPQFPMTPGETQSLLNLLYSRPEWMPPSVGAAIAGSNSSTK